MTEAEWLICEEPWPLLTFLGNRMSERKARLLAAAYCRTFDRLLNQEQWRRAAEIIERLADGLMTHMDAVNERWGLESVSAGAGGLQGLGHEAVMLAAFDFDGSGPIEPYRYVGRVAYLAANAAYIAERENPFWFRRTFFPRRERVQHSGKEAPAETKQQAQLVRDLFGNPFHPKPHLQSCVLAWNDSAVRRIAQGVYDERAFDRLPILHDALLDAGCDDETTLSHCRDAGPHVRGCWVIDLILGKE